jgi:hypothetical protein
MKFVSTKDPVSTKEAAKLDLDFSHQSICGWNNGSLGSNCLEAPEIRIGVLYDQLLLDSPLNILRNSLYLFIKK